MTDKNFALALEIVSKANNCKVNFVVPVNGSYNHPHQLVLINCDAHTINSLISQGFSLFLKEKVGLIVDKF